MIIVAKKDHAFIYTLRTKTEGQLVTFSAYLFNLSSTSQAPTISFNQRIQDYLIGNAKICALLFLFEGPNALSKPELQFFQMRDQKIQLTCLKSCNEENPAFIDQDFC